MNDKPAIKCVGGLMSLRVGMTVEQVDATLRELMRAGNLRPSLLALLDAVDYTAGNCRPNEMVSAVLDRVLITNARAALSFPDAEREARK